MMPITYIRSVLISTLLFFTLNVGFGQSQSANNWYFGNSLDNFRFVRPNYNAEAVTIPNILGNGMSAVASDPVSGAILFYTDGQNVYDRRDVVMSNGTGINGSSNLNQAIAISAFPGSANNYLIFTVSLGGVLSYTQVDMTLNPVGGIGALPLGAVVDPKNQTAGLPATNRSPAILMIPNFDEDGFYLISHEAGTNNYDVTTIDNTGAISTATTAIPAAPSTPVNFSFSEGRDQIAISSSNPADEVTLLDFDPVTGAITFNSTIAGTANAFDTQWNNNGDLLYISGNLSGTDELYQVDLTVGPPTLSALPTASNGVNAMATSYGLQMAPDSTIYHLYETVGGVFRVGNIGLPDTTAAQSLYDPAILGNTNFNGRQFPAFLPDFDPMIMASFTSVGECANAPTFFFPDVKPSPDSVRWNFGDMSFSQQYAAIHTYTQAGSYNVVLTAFVNGDSAFFTLPVTIQDFDLNFSEPPQSDTVCFEDFPVSYTAMATGNSAGGVTYQWGHEPAPGATTSIDSAGNYYVIATAPNGCEVYAPLQVVEYGLTEQTANIWYFGENAGLDFNPVFSLLNPGPVTPIDFGDPDYGGGNAMIAPEGCAIYGDNNGQVLFYSNGDEMYDREGNLIATGIGGNVNATQSIFIVPVPGDATLWYVFLTKEVYDLSNGEYQLDYVIFDLKERNGLGDLVRDATNNVQTTTLYCGTTERITGSPNWVIIHEFGTNNFLSYRITGNGIGAPVISSIGSVHSSTTSTTGQGYMKLSAGGRLAVALSNSPTENFVEVFNFDQGTGAVTDFVQLDMGVTGQVYGIEFSPGETNLFASVITGPSSGEVYFWEIDSLDTDVPFVEGTFSLIQDSNVSDGRIGALQIGPDGTIYVAKEGAAALGTITNPEGKNTIVPPLPPNPPMFMDEAQAIGNDLINGGPNISSIGLPNFVSQNVVTPSATTLSVFDGCQNTQLDFTILNPISLETYRWNILDENSQSVFSSTGTSISFSLPDPGDYIARVDIIPECDSIRNPDATFPAPVEVPFTIFADPVFSLVGNDVTGGCGNNNGSIDVTFSETGTYQYTVQGPVPTPATPFGGGNFNIPNLSAGTYAITITNLATGCLSIQSVAINEPAPFTATIGTLEAECSGQNGTISVVMSGTPTLPAYPISYVVVNESTGQVAATGTDDNADADNTFDISVNSGTYSVTVTENGATPCSVAETGVLVPTPPAAALTIPTDFAACDEPQARIDFTTDADPTTYQVSGPDSGAFFDGNTLVVSLDGNYVVTVGSDDPTSVLCATSQIVNVSFTASSESPYNSQYPICPLPAVPFSERVVMLESPPTGFISAQWFDSSGAQITGAEADYDFSGDSLIIRNDGPITGELTNAFGCVTVVDINIVEDCEARVNAPSAFRPTSALLENQNWRVFPVLVAQEDFQIFIYNRWGELIFQSSDLNFMQNEGWNGGYNNNAVRPVQGGTYAYKVQFKNNFEDNAEIEERRGGITLLR